MRLRLEALKESNCTCGRGKPLIEFCCDSCYLVLWNIFNIDTNGSLRQTMYHKLKRKQCQTRNCLEPIRFKKLHCDYCIETIFTRFTINLEAYYMEQYEDQNAPSRLIW